jgi:palmitoyltransferase ZDHHC9/14/18
MVPPSTPKAGQQSSTRASTEQSSFPNPIDINENRRPMSVASYQTDDFTDYGDPPESLGANTATPSVHASIAQDPDTRPSSAQTGFSSATPHGRFPPTSYAGSVGQSSTRPPTSQSRTHVPTLTASAFYRPMSSQRLQAQRGQRRESSLQQNPFQGRDSPELGEERDATQGTPKSSSQRKHNRRLSRGTDISDLQEADDDVPAVPDLPDTVDTAVPERTEATLRQPDQEKSSPRIPGPLDIGRLNHPGINVQPPPKSPRSFRSSLIPSRNSRQSRTSYQGRQQGHEKLPSNASTPNIADEQKIAVRKELGKNYQYFEGKTVFCLGGRFQNSRDRPINLFTGFVIVLPMILFYIFS